MATFDECVDFSLKNSRLWWRYGISRRCDEWKYIIIGRIFESESTLIPSSLKISESSSNGSYRNTDEVWWRYQISRSCDECILRSCRSLHYLATVPIEGAVLFDLHNVSSDWWIIGLIPLLWYKYKNIESTSDKFAKSDAKIPYKTCPNLRSVLNHAFVVAKRA